MTMALVHMSGLGMCDVTGLSVCIGKQSLSVCVYVLRMCVCSALWYLRCVCTRAVLPGDGIAWHRISIAVGLFSPTFTLVARTALRGAFGVKRELLQRDQSTNCRFIVNT